MFFKLRKKTNVSVKYNNVQSLGACTTVHFTIKFTIFYIRNKKNVVYEI